MRIFPVVVIIVINCWNWLYALSFSYHKYDSLTDYMEHYCRRFPNLNCQLQSIGLTKAKRHLWVLVVDAVNETQVGIPNVKLIGNIHGNEAVGRELLLHLLEYFGDNYPTDFRIKALLENTRMHIMPSMNPDGFEIAKEGLCTGEHGRYNGYHGIDLNRNFPDHFKKNYEPEQPETAAVRRWMQTVPFILSAGLHGGALVANYPFENRKQHTRRNQFAPSLTPDDDVFKYLAESYARRHPTMHLGKPCEGDKNKFENGITNGAAWYPLTGGMQDYNYVNHACMEVTLEISCCKYPFAKELSGLWESNRNALIDYSLLSQIGVKGIIVDALTNEPIQNANLKIVGRSYGFNSSTKGEFWRILLPGSYTIEVTVSGYVTKILNFHVMANSSATRLNISLYPVEQKQTVSLIDLSESIDKSGEAIRKKEKLDKNDFVTNILVNSSLDEHMDNRDLTTHNSGCVFKFVNTWYCIVIMQSFVINIFIYIKN